MTWTDFGLWTLDLPLTELPAIRIAGSFIFIVVTAGLRVAKSFGAQRTLVAGA